MSAGVHAFILPKTRMLPIPNTLKGDTGGLFSMASMPSLEALELPHGAHRIKVGFRPLVYGQRKMAGLIGRISASSPEAKLGSWIVF